jgi:2-polyprenyl-6-hydroxyphenyl methylase/3-demethylubiquinone-9 3-methyltransferase
MTRQFNFGRNWVSFARNVLTVERITQAREDFKRLFDNIPLNNKNFLDVGFGQGLPLLIAKERGACVVGNDINPRCREALAETAGKLHCSTEDIRIVIGSILDLTTVEEIRNVAKNSNGYDIVHSWGVLHHTGNMYAALDNIMRLVLPGGHLVIALYNRHFTSPLWRIIKRVYCMSPASMQKLLIAFYYPVILLAKMAVTRRSPFEQDRGMEFYHNVVDWVGGYPYEYASCSEITGYCSRAGFSCVRLIKAAVPTGCNQFVFVKSLH